MKKSVLSPVGPLALVPQSVRELAGPQGVAKAARAAMAFLIEKAPTKVPSQRFPSTPELIAPQTLARGGYVRVAPADYQEV